MSSHYFVPTKLAPNKKAPDKQGSKSSSSEATSSSEASTTPSKRSNDKSTTKSKGGKSSSSSASSTSSSSSENGKTKTEDDKDLAEFLHPTAKSHAAPFGNKAQELPDKDPLRNKPILAEFGPGKQNQWVGTPTTSPRGSLKTERSPRHSPVSNSEGISGGRHNSSFSGEVWTSNPENEDTKLPPEIVRRATQASSGSGSGSGETSSGSASKKSHTTASQGRSAAHTSPHENELRTSPTDHNTASTHSFHSHAPSTRSNAPGSTHSIHNPETSPRSHAFNNSTHSIQSHEPSARSNAPPGSTHSLHNKNEASLRSHAIDSTHSIHSHEPSTKSHGPGSTHSIHSQKNPATEYSSSPDSSSNSTGSEEPVPQIHPPASTHSIHSQQSHQPPSAMHTDHENHTSNHVQFTGKESAPASTRVQQQKQKRPIQRAKRRQRQQQPASQNNNGNCCAQQCCCCDWSMYGPDGQGPFEPLPTPTLDNPPKFLEKIEFLQKHLFDMDKYEQNVNDARVLLFGDLIHYPTPPPTPVCNCDEVWEAKEKEHVTNCDCGKEKCGCECCGCDLKMNPRPNTVVDRQELEKQIKERERGHSAEYKESKTRHSPSEHHGYDVDQHHSSHHSHHQQVVTVQTVQVEVQTPLQLGTDVNNNLVVETEKKIECSDKTVQAQRRISFQLASKRGALKYEQQTCYMTTVHPSHQGVDLSTGGTSSRVNLTIHRGNTQPSLVNQSSHGHSQGQEASIHSHHSVPPPQDDEEGALHTVGGGQQASTTGKTVKGQGMGHGRGKKRRGSRSRSRGGKGHQRRRGRSGSRGGCGPPDGNHANLGCCCPSEESESSSSSSEEDDCCQFPNQFLWFILNMNSTAQYYKSSIAYQHYYQQQAQDQRALEDAEAAAGATTEAETDYETTEYETDAAPEPAPPVGVERINISRLEDLIGMEGRNALKNKEVAVTLRPFDPNTATSLPKNPLIDLKSLRLFAHGEKEETQVETCKCDQGGCGAGGGCGGGGCCDRGGGNESGRGCCGGKGKKGDEDCCAIAPPKRPECAPGCVGNPGTVVPQSKPPAPCFMLPNGGNLAEYYQTQCTPQPSPAPYCYPPPPAQAPYPCYPPPPQVVTVPSPYPYGYPPPPPMVPLPYYGMPACPMMPGMMCVPGMNGMMAGGGGYGANEEGWEGMEEEEICDEYAEGYNEDQQNYEQAQSVAPSGQRRVSYGSGGSRKSSRHHGSQKRHSGGSGKSHRSHNKSMRGSQDYSQGGRSNKAHTSTSTNINLTYVRGDD